MPWRDTTLPLIAPLVKIGRMFSNSLIFLTSISCGSAALGGELRLPALDVGDVDGIGLSDEPVDGSRGVEVLHRHLEAEVLRCLVADRLDDGVGHPNVPQLDVLDVLGPDQREPGDCLRSRDACESGRAFQYRAAGDVDTLVRGRVLCGGRCGRWLRCIHICSLIEIIQMRPECAQRSGRLTAMPLCYAAKPSNRGWKKKMSSYYREPLTVVMNGPRSCMRGTDA